MTFILFLLCKFKPTSKFSGYAYFTDLLFEQSFNTHILFDRNPSFCFCCVHKLHSKWIRRNISSTCVLGSCGSKTVTVAGIQYCKKCAKVTICRRVHQINEPNIVEKVFLLHKGYLQSCHNFVMRLRSFLIVHILTTSYSICDLPCCPLTCFQ